MAESFLAYLITSKLHDRQPLYHLEKKLASQYGIDISRQSMSKWFNDLYQPLLPLYNLLKDYIIDYDIASLDATTLQVLNEPGRPPTRKSYVYCFRGGDHQHQVILYEYNEKDHKQFVKDWFEGFSGYIHADADPFFDLLAKQPGNTIVFCNAHARRKFEKITKQVSKPGIASRAMAIYQQLYRIEKKANQENLTSEQRYQLRQQKAKPTLSEFKKMLEEKYSFTSNKSDLGLVINYCLKHWDGLTTYLNDGRLHIDNNHTEREIKPFVIARKNFMFSGSQAGARALCLHFSLIRTAKLHGLNPYHYYVKILETVPYCQCVKDYEALLPWNIQLEKVRLDQAA